MKTLPFWIAAFLMSGFLTSCDEQAKDTNRIKTVKLEPVRSQDNQTLLQYPGKVKASEDISLAFRVSGTIRSIRVEDGQTVKAGQLLAELDPTDYQIQLDATEAQYKQVKSEAERVIALYNDGGTTPVAYDKAVYGLKKIASLYAHHKAALSYTKLYAPFNGTVQKHLCEAHETVGAGMPVLAMIGQGSPEVEINLPAAEYIRSALFCDFQCTFGLYPGKVYPLKLIGITPKANANQLYTMRLKLDVEGLPLPSPGMNTQVSIRMNDEEKRELKLPSAAVLMKDGQAGVFVFQKQDSTVHFRKVKILRLTADGQSILTSDELKADDTVVSAGVHQIREGEKVRPLSARSATNVGGLL